MERILVAVDFSDSSQNALRMALQLSKAFHAKLHLIHVIPTGKLGTKLAPIVSLVSYGALEAELRLMELVELELHGAAWNSLSIDFKVLEGNESNAIQKEALDWRASLIVVGHHGDPLNASSSLGSTSIHLLAESPVPVLVVSDRLKGALPEKILAVLDENRSTGLLQFVARWSQSLELPLSFLQVLPEPDRANMDRETATSNSWDWLHHQVITEIEDRLEEFFRSSTKPQVELRFGHESTQIRSMTLETEQPLVILSYEHFPSVFDLIQVAEQANHPGGCSVLVLRPASQQT